jgi:hypothetical protein
MEVTGNGKGRQKVYREGNVRKNKNENKETTKRMNRTQRQAVKAAVFLKGHSGGIPTSRDTRVKHIVYWTEIDQLSVTYCL